MGRRIVIGGGGGEARYTAFETRFYLKEIQKEVLTRINSTLKLSGRFVFVDTAAVSAAAARLVR